MMESINFLFIPTLISITILIFIIIFYKWTFATKKRKIWISLTVFFTIYTLIVGSAALTDIKYEKELNNFDLNQDGLFSPNEQTPEQEAAMFKLINDVGRNFSIFTGAIVAGIFGMSTYIIIWGFEKYKRLQIEEKTTHNIKLPRKSASELS